MKRRIIVVSVVLLVLITPVFAAGGKNRGDQGKGSVVQEQIRNSDCGTPAFDSGK